MHYYLSLGTNIRPEENAVQMVKALTIHFVEIVCFPFIYTQPHAMETPHTFLNTVAVIKSDLDCIEVKNHLNAIEESLGRDRSDPQRSVKDRTADIDILGRTTEMEDDFFSQFKQSYVRDVIANNFTGVDLSKWGLPPSEGAATIYFNAASGHIVVVDNANDGLVNR
ncbi:MAG: 2-amino-4-hydroxy-6-hydroxymethyldihydropteridine diphosphokinase [Lentisphaeria bacterium]|jgi:2-amino-4-hydroxy-6-hydroxymethyldihydropteridine diphosphokinase